jgi:hypothetical protein
MGLGVGRRLSHLHEGLAGLFGGGRLPPHRGWGWQPHLNLANPSFFYKFFLKI